jgi:hypothetical protein
MIRADKFQIGQRYLNSSGWVVTIIGWGKPPHSIIMWGFTLKDDTGEETQYKSTYELEYFLNSWNFVLVV